MKIVLQRNLKKNSVILADMYVPIWFNENQKDTPNEKMFIVKLNVTFFIHDFLEISVGGNM